MIDLPSSSKEVVQKTKTEFEQEVPESNPFLKASWISAVLTALGKRVYAFYVTMQLLIEQLFPDTAVDQYLDRWLAIWGLSNNAATRATGFVSFGGTVGGAIPLATAMNATNGLTYLVINAGVVSHVIVNVVSIVRSGTVAVVTTDIPHNLTSSIPATILGALEPEYNVVGATVTPLDALTFSYSVDGTPTTPANGAITAEYNLALVSIESSGFGSANNLAPNERITLAAPINDVDETGRPNADGVSGGSDAETNTAKRVRLLDRIRNPVAHFNASAIEQQMKSVTGVTRVWIFEATPVAGFVSCYFVRDLDNDIFPDAGEVTTVKGKVLEIKPVTIDSANVLLAAPVDYPANFDFTSITPDTPSMRTAIVQSLEQFFLDFSNVAEAINEASYKGAISATVDTITGDRLTDFDLVQSGSITPPSNALSTVGVVAYL
jgi:uncharacterized phage protein gp47/JayE